MWPREEISCPWTRSVLTVRKPYMSVVSFRNTRVKRMNGHFDSKKKKLQFNLKNFWRNNNFKKSNVEYDKWLPEPLLFAKVAHTMGVFNMLESLLVTSMPGPGVLRQCNLCVSLQHIRKIIIFLRSHHFVVFFLNWYWKKKKGLIYFLKLFSFSRSPTRSICSPINNINNNKKTKKRGTYLLGKSKRDGKK